MSEIAKESAEAEGVHRLVDMVVEEVSLVDRAANKHRFLIVKRDDAMNDDSNQDPAEVEAPSDPAPAEKVEGSPALDTAIAALESLTAIVELLGSLGAEGNDTRLAALGEQLRVTAEQILEGAGGSSGDDGGAAEVEARAKEEAAPNTSPNTPSNTPSIAPPNNPVTPAFSNDVAAAKLALARLAEIASKAVPMKTTEKRDAPSGEGQTTPDLPGSLAKLADSFRALSETVREQQQRIGRVEKQFGLPNSASAAEQIAKASAEDVGWPLDLNKPKDRESVDKAVSFHDL